MCTGKVNFPIESKKVFPFSGYRIFSVIFFPFLLFFSVNLIFNICSGGVSADSRGDRFDRLTWLEIFSGKSRKAWSPYLVGNEILGCPTTDSISIHIVPRCNLFVYVSYRAIDNEKDDAAGSVHEKTTPILSARGMQPLKITLQNLEPFGKYRYQLFCSRQEKGPYLPGPEHTFRTGREKGASFTFAISSDSHMIPHGSHDIYHATLDNIARLNPDFYMTLGDEAMIHSYSMFRPALTWKEAEHRYLFYRTMVSRITGSVPYFFVIGNHEGESGFYRSLFPGLPGRALAARKRFIPNPGENTYPQGGGDRDNYFAFAWGDALFVVLDVCFYNNRKPAYPDDWTIGNRQWEWLQNVLRKAPEKWKFIFAHHIVGGWPYGATGDAPGDGMWDFPYGRGGAALAQVGEQARLQALMEETGVSAFFYGHDHVFAHGETRGVHYICCGQSGDVGALPWFNLSRFHAVYPDGFIPRNGWVQVEVDRQGTRISFINSSADRSNGTTIHSFVIKAGKP